MKEISKLTYKPSSVALLYCNLTSTIPAVTLNGRLLVQAARCYKCATVQLKTVRYTVCEAERM